MAIMKMSVDKGGRPSADDVEVVQLRVEQCIKKYMSKTEAVKTLSSSGQIQSKLTEIVWDMLEEYNKEFFRAYYAILLVKDQIQKFNSLLQEQVELMHQSGLTQSRTGFNSDGANIFPTQQFSMLIPAQGTQSMIVEETVQTNGYNSYRLSMQPFVQGILNQSGHNIESGFSPIMSLSQNSNMVQEQIVNLQIAGSQFNFCTPNNCLQPHPLMGNASALPVRTVLYSAQYPNLFLDSDALFLEQYHNIVTSQVAADFTSSYDLGLVESSNRHPFPARGTNNFDPNAADEMLDHASAMMRNPFWS